MSDSSQYMLKMLVWLTNFALKITIFDHVYGAR